MDRLSYCTVASFADLILKDLLFFFCFCFFVVFFCFFVLTNLALETR